MAGLVVVKFETSRLFFLPREHERASIEWKVTLYRSVWSVKLTFFLFSPALCPPSVCVRSWLPSSDDLLVVLLHSPMVVRFVTTATWTVDILTDVHDNTTTSFLAMLVNLVVLVTISNTNITGIPRIIVGIDATMMITGDDAMTLTEKIQGGVLRERMGDGVINVMEEEDCRTILWMRSLLTSSWFEG